MREHLFIEKLFSSLFPCSNLPWIIIQSERMSETDTDSEAEISEKEKSKSRKNLLSSEKDLNEVGLTLRKRNSGTSKKNHALLERLNRIKTPSEKPRVQTKEEVLERDVEILREQLKENGERISKLEETMGQCTKEKRVDETCCIGYCVIS